MVNILLNHFDEDGTPVDSDTMDLNEDQISDIVDHAIQAIFLWRKGEIEAFENVMFELENALVVYNIIEEEES